MGRVRGALPLALGQCPFRARTKSAAPLENSGHAPNDLVSEEDDRHRIAYLALALA
jgi:hypothetical protein